MHNQLEKYLSQIEKQLAALPAEQRQEELREIRSHLEMMIEGNIASGLDSDEAVKKALEQFGAADKLARDLKFAPDTKRTFLLKHWFRAFRTVAVTLAVYEMLSFTINSGVVPHPPSISSNLNLIWMTAAFFLLGWINEFLKPQKMISSLRIRVVYWCCVSVSFAGIFLAFTCFPQVLNYMPIFAFAAFFAGMGTRRWQKPRQSMITN